MNADISDAFKELLITHPPQKGSYEKGYTVYISQGEGKKHLVPGYYVVFGGIQKRQMAQ